MTVLYPELNNKRVLITGASSGIGAGIARVLAREGCRLVLHYNRNEAGIEKTLSDVQALGAEAEVLHCDFRELDRVVPFFEAAWQAFNGLDALINNAGIVSKVTSLKDPHGEAFDEVLAVNLQAPYRLATAFAQHCIEAGHGGVVVNNSSIHGQKSCEWFSAYGAAKAGLDRLTEVQAIEWGPHGIRLVGIAPGVVPVERTEVILSQPPVKDRWMKCTPLGRYGTTDEMGEAVAFLISDRAAWMTGSILTVDGGLIARGNYPFRDEMTKS
ncbi:glucose 1-dehydrogenase [Sulfurivirga caldicuralii]|uniref:Glucose 1-dehydrogenase n=1 Tax=Sulfurivirga caldicuralii TaxID=364032 RepID=A0A1N6H6R6_9GAMM|nr:SDR family oxidoreductase [Sulfurivirga caldicuralii]SIO15456.1 glucose 1-dehydrogenase [Sulfurivirga caldicuralii]